MAGRESWEVRRAVEEGWGEAMEQAVEVDGKDALLSRVLKIKDTETNSNCRTHIESVMF